ncbi:kinase-like domain-containing protein [Rhizophagus irregularis DAOM 181602=DAOM 197198]|nr:kinase-like domain-containing protein [Rhizophagus irregularis DAOM 181602=DAOM 197198]
MEIVNANDENSFDPTPRLKSSPIPIKFIPFNCRDENCVYCGEKYIRTLFCYLQQYCKKCLSRYINDITDNNIYLDLYIYTEDLECSEHEISSTKVPQSIQECCANCVRILCFKQIYDSYGIVYGGTDKNISILYNKVIESEKNCKLCGMSLYQGTDKWIMKQFKLCSDCYIISSELIESTLVKKQISILYLPWWHNNSHCDVCDSELTFTSDCQKSISIVKEIAKGGYGIIYKATWSSKNKTVILKRFENSKNIDKYFLNELNSCQHCFENFNSYIIQTYGFTKDPELEDYILVIEYASGGDLHKYLQKKFTNITWNKQKLLILYDISKGLETIHNKKFMHRDFHSGNILCYSSSRYYGTSSKYKHDDLRIGDLGLSQAVNNKSSNNEIYGVIPYIAPEIFKGSEFSKEADIYSFGMIMWELTTGCKPFDNVEHDHSLIYKILDGERPKITEDTPECYANLMKSCWNPDPKKRPIIKEIRSTFSEWIFRIKNKAEFIQAEENRKKLIESKNIGPVFAEKRHPGAIYTSRPLSALISKCSSIYSSTTISFGKQDSNYISELQDDKDTESLSSQNLNFAIQKSSTSLNSNYISEELEFDILENESLSSQNLSFTIQNYSTTLDSSRYISAELDLDINTESLSSQNLSYSRYISTELELDINTESFRSQNLKKRRNEEFLNLETHDDSGKRIKTNFNYP